MDYDEGKYAPYVGIDISKRRSLINRPTSFSDQPGLVMEEILPDRSLESEYVLRLKMCRNIQTGGDTSACSVNTKSVSLVCQGMSHTEGGWPKDINVDDLEQRSRFRKKVEKEDEFINTTCKLATETEKYVRQNNTINIFEEYFRDDDDATNIKPATVGSVCVFKDPMGSGDRAINQVCWSPSGDKIALAFCNTEYLAYYDRSIDHTSLVYDVSNPLSPLLHLTPHSPLMTLQYNKKEHFMLAGGTLSGHLVLLDSRVGGEPVIVVEVADADRRGDPVTSLQWITCKTGTEIIASVADGHVVKWDTRGTTPLTCIDTNLEREQGQEPQHGVTGLCYDVSVPHRYLVSTDLGSVLSCGLKNDNILAEYNTGFCGSLHSVQRNPLYNKIFLTAGDRSLKVWSEDVRCSAIMVAGDNAEVTSAIWSPVRPSVMVSGNEEGQVMTWDLTYHHTKPLVLSKVSDQAITDIKFNSSGNLALVSNTAG